MPVLVYASITGWLGEGSGDALIQVHGGLLRAVLPCAPPLSGLACWACLLSHPTASKRSYGLLSLPAITN
jgi:hypothetical protein